MKMVTLGSTGICTPQNAFGALPIQRVSHEYAGMLLKKAYAAGMTFFDTARGYSDSEEKMGLALADVRDKIFIATKTPAKDAPSFWKDLETSLRNLKTDYIDLYQFHNPAFCPRPGDGTGLYEAMLEAKAQGKIRHIGITNHRLPVAEEAVKSGLYETLQFPFCYLAAEQDIALVNLCKAHNVGFIAMKGLSGGLINRADAAFAYIAQFDNVLPIWGIQRESELDEFIRFMDEPPQMTGEIEQLVLRDRQELIGDFCRSCGYCMPCPQDIQIFACARMSQLIRRSPSANWLDEKSQKMMENIENCLECGQCESRCPYGLKIIPLLKKNLADYRDILAGKVQI